LIERGGRWPPAGGTVRSVAVVVDVPYANSIGALLFSGPGAGIEELFGEDAVNYPRCCSY
jgi:hypothetical protein